MENQNSFQFQENITFEEFKDSWLENRGLTDDNLTSLQKGQLLGFKLLENYLDFELNNEKENLYELDRSNDGGIDLAFFRKGEINAENETQESDIWYLVQTKFNILANKFANLYTEVDKILKTLENSNKLHKEAQELVDKVNKFRNEKEGEIYIIYGTVNPLDSDSLNEVARFNNHLHASYPEIKLIPISLANIFEDYGKVVSIKVGLKAHLSHPANNNADIWCGVVQLPYFYEFLSEYKKRTGDFNMIFEKNVRKFLGFRGKINKKIRESLEKNPKEFGLYNNGVTIVVSQTPKAKKVFDRFVPNGKIKNYELYDPYIVNGCQTTSVIFDVLEKANQKGELDKLYASAVVVVKIIPAADNKILLNNIVRFANTQKCRKRARFSVVGK